MKGKEIKNTGKLVELKDGNHKLTIDYNAYSELEEIYGDIQTALGHFSGSVKSKDTRNYLTAAINACIEKEEDHYTPFQIGKLLDPLKNQYYVDIISQLLVAASPETEEDTDTESNTSVEDGKN